MTVCKYYNIHNLIKFKICDGQNRFLNYINSEGLFAEYINYLTDYVDDSELDFEVNIVNDLTPKSNCDILDDNYYVDKGYIFTNDKYKVAKWAIEIIYNNQKMVTNIKPNYFARYFISGFFVDFMIQFFMVQKGVSMVHASSLCKTGSAIIFSGRGGSGKTSIVVNSLNQYIDLDFLGDDFAIVLDGSVFSYVTPFNLFSYNTNDFLLRYFDMFRKIGYYFKKLVYLLSAGYAKFFTKLNPMNYFSERIGSKSFLSDVFIIFPTNDVDLEIKKQLISKELAVKYLKHNMMLDSSFFPKYLIQYGFLFIDELSSYWDAYEMCLLRNLPDSVCFNLVYLPKNVVWNELMNEVIGGSV